MRRLTPATCGMGVVMALSHLNAQRVTTRDSLGIRIVETGGRQNSPAVFSLSDAPAVNLGGLENDPNLEFDARSGHFAAIRLGNGNLVVADKTRLQMFDRVGKRLAIVGRAGRGPEEFANIAGLCRTRGDTIVVSDDQLLRVSVIDRDGKFVRAFRTNGYMSEGQFCFSDGSILGVRRLVAGADGRLTALLVRVTLDGVEAKQLGPVEFGPYDSGVGRLVSVVAAGQGYYFGNAIAHEIQLFDSDGRLTQLIRTADPLHRITDAELRFGGPITKGGGGRRPDRGVDQLKIKTWPAYRQLRSDPSGRIWVREWVPQMVDAREETWTALDANGTVLGRLIMPLPASKDSSRMVVSFGTDEVLLRETDSDGAVHLVVRRLAQRRTTPR